MAQIKIPQRKQNDALGKLLTIGGGAAGFAIGGPAGILPGMSAGQMAGGLVQKPQEQGITPVGRPEDVGSALDRRLEALDATPQAQLRNSINSLQYIQDPEMRADLAKPLLQAQYVAKMKGQG